MGDSILLFTPSTLTDEDVERLVTDLGGVNSNGNLILSDGAGTVWPGVDPVGPEQQWEPEELATMAAMAGGPIRTLVAVDLSRSPGTFRVAGRFIEHFAARHPCVVERTRCCDKLIMPERALALLRQDRSLSEPCPVHGTNMGRPGGWRRWRDR